MISRRAKFCSVPSQFFEHFSSFLKLSLACVTALFVLFHLLSLALTRFNSRHCPVFSSISPPFLHWAADALSRSSPLIRLLSGSLSKSGPLDFGTKNNFPSFFVSEKGLVHIYKKAIYYFPVSYFCFATSQNRILAELQLPSVIRKVKFTDFVKRATSPKMQLAEFRFHTNSKVHSLL